MRMHRVIGFALLTVGALSATVMPYNYTTSGTIAGSPADIAFTPQSTAVSGSTNAAGTALGLRLGSFTLTKPGAQTTIDYNNLFTLNVAFTNPTITGSTSFSGLLSGVLKQGTGKSDVDFVLNPSSQILHFTSPYAGAFILTLHDILNMSYSSGNRETYALTGDITQATDGTSLNGPGLSAVPEPASVFLLLGVVGVVALTMRRRLFDTHRRT